jgi:WD40-like Beta Propeller Repeat
MTDDQLRRSLLAEAGDVIAGLELEARVRTAVTAAASRRRRRRTLLAGAAAVAVIATGTAALLLPDWGKAAEQDVQAGSSGAPAAPAPARPSPAPAGQPERVAFVRDDGMLVVLDTLTGSYVERYTAGTQNINAVDLSPDGRWAYFSTCCEHGVGATWRLPITGGPPVQVGDIIGGHPRVSPDGLTVAAAAGQHLNVVPFDATLDSQRSTIMAPGTVGDLAWSPDGTRLAYTVTSDSGSTEVRVASYRDGHLTTDAGVAPQPGRFGVWRPDGTLQVLAAGPVAVSQDASYTWILTVGEDGTAAAVPGVQDAVAADW